MLKPFTIDASVRIWLPFFSIQTKTVMTEFQNYKNEEKQLSDGNVGIEVRFHPMVKIFPHVEWRSKLLYLYFNVNSTHTVTRDLNDDGDFIDLTELKSKNTHPHAIQIFGGGMGVNYSVLKKDCFFPTYRGWRKT